MPPTDDLIGTPSLLILAVMATLTFATVARWVRAPRSLVLAAVAASLAFAAHNAVFGRETYGGYWGTFPAYQLTGAELLVLYVTQALVFVGGSGVFLAGVSRERRWWVVPFLWSGGWLVVTVTVLLMSHVVSDVFHWPWVRVSLATGTKFWGGRLAMAYVFIAFIGRERKANAAVETTPGVENDGGLAQRGEAPASASQSVGKTSSEGRSMWQRLLFTAVLVGLLAIMGATLSHSAARADELKAEQEAAQLDFAKRLRADGDRLASEGRWADALARYDQAQPYDRKGDQASETEKKRQEMNSHVGRVVFNKDFDDRGTPP